MDPKFQAKRMQDAAKKYREERKAAGLKTTKTPTERATENPKSLRAAINAKCYSCVGEDSDPGWRWEVGNCLVRSCSLRPVRPYQKLEGTDAPLGRLP